MPLSDDGPHGEMTAVEGNERERPPMHFGESPHVAYLSAELNEAKDVVGSDEYTVSGQVIRLMWDYGVVVPLWDAEGLLPEEPEWLRAALGLSDALIEALRRWGHDMNALNTMSGLPEAIPRALHARAQDMADQLQRQLGARFTVTYRPW